MDSLTSNWSCNSGYWYLNFGVSFPEVVVEGMILSTSVVLNLLLLATVCCSRLLRSSTHIFISSLAVSDILVSIYGLGYLAIDVMVDRMCFSLASRDDIGKGINICYLVNTFSVYMNILFVSGERWLFISRPFLHERLISRRFTFIGVAVVWISSVLVNLDGFIVTLKYYFAVADIKSDVVFPCIHILVTVVMGPIYVHLTIITRRQMAAINKTRRVGQRNNNTRNDQHKNTRNVQQTDTKMKLLRKNMRSIRLLVTVFGGFVVLLSPGIYYHFWVRFSWNHQKHLHIHGGFKLLTYSHSCVNFIVFASLDRCFRRVLMTWLRKATCRHVRCVSEVQNPISMCRRCRTGHKVNVGNSIPTVASITVTPRH